MDKQLLLNYCLDKQGSELFEQGQTKGDKIKVGGKMFALFSDINGRPTVSFKTSCEQAKQLRKEYADEIVPGNGLNKAHWNTLFLDGNISSAFFFDAVDSSYQLIVSELTESVQQQLGS